MKSIKEYLVSDITLAIDEEPMWTAEVPADSITQPDTYFVFINSGYLKQHTAKLKKIKEGTHVNIGSHYNLYDYLKMFNKSYKPGWFLVLVFEQMGQREPDFIGIEAVENEQGKPDIDYLGVMWDINNLTNSLKPYENSIDRFLDSLIRYNS